MHMMDSVKPARTRPVAHRTHDSFTAARDELVCSVMFPASSCLTMEQAKVYPTLRPSCGESNTTIGRSTTLFPSKRTSATVGVSEIVWPPPQPPLPFAQVDSSLFGLTIRRSLSSRHRLQWVEKQGTGKRLEVTWYTSCLAEYLILRPSTREHSCVCLYRFPRCRVRDGTESAAYFAGPGPVGGHVGCHQGN